MSTFDSKILENFAISGKLVSSSDLKRGHINETFVSVWENANKKFRYIHQRVNHEVFKDVSMLMKNISIVTRHLEDKFSKGQGVEGETTLSIVPTRLGALFHEDLSGNFWRTYRFIENTHCLDVCTDPDEAYQASRAFGRFTRYLSDLDPASLGETIPGFQDSLHRFRQFDGAIQSDSKHRVHSAADQINFALKYRALADKFAEAKAGGGVRIRATHSDPKINNVLLDEKSGVGICIVDLDTCMPGTVLYDFGDLARNTSIPAAEDEQDFSRVFVDDELFEAVARGYLMECGTLLTREEIKLLPQSACLLALTLGVRFLTDHLNGDTYFRIHHENHNLQRARTQFEIVRGMLAVEDKLERIVQKCLK